MSTLPELIQQYAGLLEQERELATSKEVLRTAILAGLSSQHLDRFASPHGTARRAIRFKLLPKRETVLALLKPEDLFPFAQFTPKRVTEILIPKYGRESLLPLFEVQKSAYLLVQMPRPPQAQAGPW